MDLGAFRESYAADVRAAAEAFRGQPIPLLRFSSYRRFDTDGDRLTYEEAYFHRRRRLSAFALAALLSGGVGDIAELEEILWAICEEYTWALPAHLQGKSLEPLPHDRFLDLFSCETAFALSEILSIHGATLTPVVRDRAREEVFRRVLRPFVARGEPWPWELMVNNWCAVCAGSVGAAALYLEGDRDELTRILDRAYPTLDRFLQSFSEDGACLEGLGYWTYGFGFFVSFADLLRRDSRFGVDLLADSRVGAIAAFQQRAYLNDRLSVSFADGSPRDRFRAGLAAYLARAVPGVRVPDPRMAASFSDDYCGRWCLAYRDYLWTGEAEAPPAAVPVDAGTAASEEEALCAYFPAAQWAICPAPEAGTFAFAAKGGHNDEPHNHNDIGSFELAKGEDIFFADIGCGEYVKDYFNENRYRFFVNASAGHSVPIVGGEGQKAGADFRASDAVFESRPWGADFTLRMDGAYGDPSLASAARRFSFDSRKGLSVVDRFEFASPGCTLVERFVTPIEPAEHARGLVLKGAESSVLFSWSSGGARIEPRISRVEYRNHQGGASSVYTIDFDLETRDGAAEFAARIEPVSL